MLDAGFRSTRQGLAALQLALGMAWPGVHAQELPDIQVRVDKREGVFIVEAYGRLPVSVATAWSVLTDFERMPEIMNNLAESRIVARAGNTLTVLQRGTAHYGPFSYDFESVREITLDAPRRIDSRQVSGRARSFSSVARLKPDGDTTELRYHAEIEPDGRLAQLVGRPFVRDEIDEQLTLMAREMLRREGKARPTDGPPARAKTER